MWQVLLRYIFSSIGFKINLPLIKKVCNRGQCVLNQNQPPNTCSSGDMMISSRQLNEIDNIINSKGPIDCDKYLDEIYTAKNSKALCDKNSISSLCCNACQSIKNE
jgi:hypothetical protein